MVPTQQSHILRNAITKAYRMDENACLEGLIKAVRFDPTLLNRIKDTATDLVAKTREYKKKQGKIDTLLHQYDLSTDEGVALMCLAEALLRIPNKYTIDKFISDKLSPVEWQNHLGSEQSFFVNAATWSLFLTGKIYAAGLDDRKNWAVSLKRLINRMGIAMIRPLIFQIMKAIGKQFVMGETIESALKRAQTLEKMGYSFSYDMLGEAARTKEDAASYYHSYEKAITAIGEAAKKKSPAENPGISIKLSALHPRYEYSQYERVVKEVTPQLLQLAQLAKKYNIGLTVDAEEADRLDLSLDIFENVFKDPTLAGWEGLGLALQAYQKRAFFVIDWLADLAKNNSKRIMVRLVKGAYWDAEIKLSQVQGLNGYPVFTRKHGTDVSYLACSKKLLSYSELFYAQFATHNAYSVAAIMELIDHKIDFEFQCLHGMGRPLYDHVVTEEKYHYPCRIYAPVGTHKDLLGYLVRRLLENGANSSFVNKLADDKTPIEQMIVDPVARVASLSNKSHPKIPLPKDIYHHWHNSQGIDVSDPSEQKKLLEKITSDKQKTWKAASIVNGQSQVREQAIKVVSPSDIRHTIGEVQVATDNDIALALESAHQATTEWANISIEDRANIFERAANLLQNNMQEFISLIILEGGRSILDSISEVREAIDFCRYYAYRVRKDLTPIELPGPTGEFNQLSLHPRGVIASISPWNFPLAIFTGQIVAALITGNTVIAKPAEQTPLIAFKTIQLLHEAGVPKNALHLLIGSGEKVGAKLVSDTRVAGVMFTGSTETAKVIEQTLAHREGPIALLVAETGGQNAMIVDSSALLEQVVIDVAQSAFNSAGQRCSALRVLFVQDEIAPQLINMLRGYMSEIKLGDPSLLSTDVGPIIDEEALKTLKEHVLTMQEKGKLIAEVSKPTHLNGYYFNPCVFELDDLSILKREVFGPILHIIRYSAKDLDKVMEAIIKTGYGLTLGIHSRIDTTIQYIINRMPVGNTYVNRNMIGDVVGVQPFGGERLSGTGPKAGGPHYLTRLCVERSLSNNTTAVGGNARLVSLIEDED